MDRLCEAADRWHEATERRKQELLASISMLERQDRDRGVTVLVPTKGLPSHEVELRTIGEALELVTLEQDLEHDRLEAMKREVMTAEAALASRKPVSRRRSTRGLRRSARPFPRTIVRS